MRVRARPVTWAAHPEDPLRVFVPGGTNQSLVMFTPGAQMSTPIFVLVSTEPTELGDRAGGEDNHTLSEAGVRGNVVGIINGPYCEGKRLRGRRIIAGI